MPPVDPEDLLKKMEKNHSDLKKWLDDALEANEKVVYVSLGNVCDW